MMGAFADEFGQSLLQMVGRMRVHRFIAVGLIFGVARQGVGVV